MNNLQNLIALGEGFTTEFKRSGTSQFISELSDICEEFNFKDELSGFNVLSISSFVSPVIEVLRTEPEEVVRATCLRNGILGTQGLRLPVRTLVRLQEKVGYVLRMEFLSPIQNLCVSRMREHAENMSLLSNPDCQTILYFWGKWAGSFDEPKEWVRQCSQSDDALIPLLKVFACYLYSSAAPGDGKVDYYDLDSLERYIPASDLEKRIKTIDPNSLSEDDQKLVSLFYEHFNLKQAGEPYGVDREEIW